MKIALVTGASSGLGRTFVNLIPEYYKNLDEIWVVARRKERLLELQKEIGVPVRVFAGDLSKDEVYNQIIDSLNQEKPEIRLLVNGAGFGLIGDFNSHSINDEASMIELNCVALTKMSGLCLPYLSKGSRAINIASAAAFGPQPGFAVYAASKSYVYHLSLALRSEWKEKKIYVTCLCPGPVETEFFERSGQTIKESKKKYLLQQEEVVRTAFLDSKKKKALSIPGISMKLAKIGSKILPDTLVAEFMKHQNK